jgi:hypothetical protein
MTSIVSYENPHPSLPPVKDRIKGQYYLYKGELRYWDGKRLRNREKNAERLKKYYYKNLKKMTEKNKKWREKNKKEIKKKYHEGGGKAYFKKYKEKNKKKIAEKKKKYREEKKQEIAEKRKKWYKNPKNKEKVNKYERDRRNTDPLYKLKGNLRSRFYDAIMAKNAYKNKKHDTFTYICCTIAFVLQYIESQFTDGMSWDNYGRGDDKWNMDHRRPCESFDFNIEEEIFMCWHWTNLQPMWQPENLSKGDKFDPKTFPYKWMDEETGWVGIRVI